MSALQNWFKLVYSPFGILDRATCSAHLTPAPTRKSNVTKLNSILELTVLSIYWRENWSLMIAKRYFFFFQLLKVGAPYLKEKIMKKWVVLRVIKTIEKYFTEWYRDGSASEKKVMRYFKPLWFLTICIYLELKVLCVLHTYVYICKVRKSYPTFTQCLITVKWWRKLLIMQISQWSQNHHQVAFDFWWNCNDLPVVHNKIKKAQNKDLNFWTFWGLYHLVFDLETIGFIVW